MSAFADNEATMAVFLDLENVAIGARESRISKFDIQKVLERLLPKGLIVVKKAYCDWDRYKDFKRGLHEAAFELIEIPHTRQSGKNSADIRMVVDALDLCHTKQHVDTFVIISGDSDFSPLVSKLRENAKTVVGVGVRDSTSDLFVSNCDAFLYYDDLVAARPQRPTRSAAKRAAPKPGNQGSSEALEKALELLEETLETLAEDRKEGRPIWASMVKEAIKRRDPSFNERACGLRSFNALLQEAQARGLIQLHEDEKSGSFTVTLVD